MMYKLLTSLRISHFILFTCSLFDTSIGDCECQALSCALQECKKLEFLEWVCWTGLMEPLSHAIPQYISYHITYVLCGRDHWMFVVGNDCLSSQINSYFWIYKLTTATFHWLPNYYLPDCYLPHVTSSTIKCYQYIASTKTHKSTLQLIICFIFVSYIFPTAKTYSKMMNRVVPISMVYKSTPLNILTNLLWISSSGLQIEWHTITMSQLCKVEHILQKNDQETFAKPLWKWKKKMWQLKSFSQQ